MSFRQVSRVCQLGYQSVWKMVLHSRISMAQDKPLYHSATGLQWLRLAVPASTEGKLVPSPWTDGDTYEPSRLIMTPPSGLAHKIIIVLINRFLHIYSLLSALSKGTNGTDNMRRWFFSLELSAGNIWICVTLIWQGSVLSPFISVVFGSNSDFVLLLYGQDFLICFELSGRAI